MTITDIKNKFKSSIISKEDFINKMHDFHKNLFDFSINLKDTEIARIEIDDDSVLFTTRSTNYHPGGAIFKVDVLDKRVTPIDAFNFQFYEKEDSEMLFKLVKEGDTIFDIGANIGWYSIHLSLKFPKAQIYAFEPIPETYNQLSINVNLNKITTIRLNNLAFSTKREKLTFFYSPSLTGASSSMNITQNQSMTQVECQADSIDNYVLSHQIASVDFIKCDVEGAEYFVFQGGLETFKNHKPIVFTEMLRKWSSKFGYHPNDIIDFFATNGYTCFTMNKGKIDPIGDITTETVETNFLFLHTVKHKSLIVDLT